MAGCDASDPPGDLGGVDASAGGADRDASPPDGRPDAGAPAADAGRTPAGDPADPGAYAVHVADDVAIPVGGGTATATICSPSDDGGGHPAAGRFPLVILSPGFQLPRDQYASACRHLASWGFVVVLQDYAGDGGILSPPNHQQLAEDVGDVIDWVLDASDGLAARVDAAHIATVGHSLGGKVSILAAILDDRVGATVGWDPVDATPPIDNGSPSVTPERMDELTVPIAVLGETLDATGGFSPCAPAEDNYVQYFEHACAAPVALEITIDGADHMDWVDDRAGCGFTCSVCRTGTADDAHTRAITRRATTAFLLAHLMGAGGYESFLAPPQLGEGASVRAGPACP